jgi:hypothetical protein
VFLVSFDVLFIYNITPPIIVLFVNGVCFNQPAAGDVTPNKDKVSQYPSTHESILFSIY